MPISLDNLPASLNNSVRLLEAMPSTTKQMPRIAGELYSAISYAMDNIKDGFAFVEIIIETKDRATIHVCASRLRKAIKDKGIIFEVQIRNDDNFKGRFIVDMKVWAIKKTEHAKREGNLIPASSSEETINSIFNLL